MSLDIKHLIVKYGSKTAISDISLEVKSGQIVALVGPNGAGKSTLIRAISGVQPVDSGQVLYRKQDLLSLSYANRARILGVVPQARQLGGAFTVWQTVMLGRTAYMSWLGRERVEDREAVAWAMERTAITAFAHRRNAELSGGEQQRVLLARALAQKTPVLLLDEPTNHLDLQHQINFLSLVLKLAKQEDLAVLMAMHDLNLVSTFSDQVAFLVKGKLLAFGTPGEVFTEDAIAAGYQTQVEIISHPEYATPLVLPRRD